MPAPHWVGGDMEGDTATAREGGGGRVKGGVERSSEGESDMSDLIPEMEEGHPCL